MSLEDDLRINVGYEWAQETHFVTIALIQAGQGDDSHGLNTLQQGQGDNQSVQQEYSDAFNSFGAEKFWNIVSTIVSKPADFVAMQSAVNTEASFQDGLNALTDAYQAWKGSGWRADILGIGRLCDGEYGNASTCLLYTACWANDPAHVKKIVNNFFGSDGLIRPEYSKNVITEELLPTKRAEICTEIRMLEKKRSQKNAELIHLDAMAMRGIRNFSG
jgi:hypothetical protein